MPIIFIVLENVRCVRCVCVCTLDWMWFYRKLGVPWSMPSHLINANAIIRNASIFASIIVYNKAYITTFQCIFLAFNSFNQVVKLCYSMQCDIKLMHVFFSLHEFNKWPKQNGFNKWPKQNKKSRWSSKLKIDVSHTEQVNSGYYSCDISWL